MAVVSGKYDEICTVAREAAEAEAVILIVLNGVAGNGFSVQCENSLLFLMAPLLRKIADDIEAAIPKA